MKIKDFLVFKEVDFWEKKKVFLKKPVKSQTVFSPIVTVSREPGSGGRPIARLLAKKLGFKFYDKRVVNLIAKDTRHKKKLVKQLDERGFGTLEGILTSFGQSGYIPPIAYVKSLWKVILAISQKGKVVVLGRGANFIAPPKTSLRLRIIAPLRERIKRAIKYEGHSPKKAERVIRYYHFDRKSFVKKYFHKNISNANYYDLVINTRVLNIEDSVAIAQAAFKEKF